MPRFCSLRGAWSGWCVAASFYLTDVCLRLSVDVVTLELQKEYNIGAASCSLAFGSSFFYAYAAGQLPIGILLDVIGPGKTLFLCAGLAAGGTFLFGATKSVTVGAFARAMSGLGCGCGWLGAVKVTRTSFGYDSKTSKMMFGVTCMLGGFGGLVSQAPFQALVTATGWRAAFKILAIFPAIIAVAALVFIESEPSHRDGAADGVVTNVSYTDIDRLEENDAPQQQQQQQPQLSKALWIIVTSPRLWLYALYIGGTDAPFETFTGLWGVPYFHQALGWTHSSAALGTTILVVVATASQLSGGPLLATVLCTRTRQMASLLALALAGALAFVLTQMPPMAVSKIAITLGIVGLLGGSVGSCTIIWHIVSSDPLCVGSTGLGRVSGAVNTVVIGIDAVVQQLVGIVLAMEWSKHRKVDPKSGVRIYSAMAYSRAFLILIGTFVVSAICICILWLWCWDNNLPSRTMHTNDGGMPATAAVAEEDGERKETHCSQIVNNPSRASNLAGSEGPDGGAAACSNNSYRRLGEIK